jgi:hypothetical protein
MCITAPVTVGYITEIMPFNPKIVLAVRLQLEAGIWQVFNPKPQQFPA